MKSSLIAWFLSFPIILSAQIGNASFENGDEDSIALWSLKSGKGGVYKSYVYQDSVGDRTAKAIDGDRFLVLEGNESSEAVVSTRFSLKENYAALYANFIYLQEDGGQRFSIEITYLNWLPALLRNDTVMHRVERINPNQSNSKVYDWLEFEIPINEDYFLSREQPDSCVITIRTNGGETTSKLNVLLLDDIYFSEQIVFSVPDFLVESPDIYPNPSDGLVSIANVKPGDKFLVSDLHGKVVLSGMATTSNLSVELEEAGFYLLTIENEDYRQTHRLMINR